MSNKKDNIYVYLWEEFNTVYIGRTVNLKADTTNIDISQLKELINLVVSMELNILR